MNSRVCAWPSLIPLVVAGYVFLASGLADAAHAAERPNILFVVADDLGWADVGWHGAKFRTPVLDGLVKDGVELDRHYVQPVCSPTRTALMSGRWTSRFGPHVLGPTNLRAFPKGTVTLPMALKECGYTCAIAGKWHLGSRPEWGPNHYGFDHSYGSLTGAVDPWTHQYRKGPWQHTWHRNHQFLNETGNATELVAKEVAGWIRQLPEPWFVFVPFHAVHIPVDAPDQYKQPFANTEFDSDAKKNESLRRMAAFVAQLDAKVGVFVTALDASNRRARTLIVFTSDNGGKTKGDNPYVGTVPPTPALSSNVPLRGEKAQLYEGGIRVSAFAHWKGTLKPGRATGFMHIADWMPTLTGLAGWKKPESLAFDGRDMWPVVSGSVRELPARPIYIPMRRGWTVLHDGWKLIVKDAMSTGAAMEPDPDDPAELYHVAADPSEKEDVAAKEPTRVASLHAMLRTLRQNDLKELPGDLRGIKD